jgi:hypothetical protein
VIPTNTVLGDVPKMVAGYPGTDYSNDTSGRCICEVRYVTDYTGSGTTYSWSHIADTPSWMYQSVSVALPKHWRWYDVFRTYKAVVIPKLDNPYVGRRYSNRNSCSIVQRRRAKRRMFVQACYCF